MKNIRLDELLLDRGIASDRREAEALILSGAVFLGDRRLDKPGMRVDPQAEIRLEPACRRYVSRGGLKLEGAIEALQVPVEGATCLDLGASTGGFTDCLLQYGARKVYAFDVGKGQLDWKLRHDPRVVVREGVNVRFLKPDVLGEPVNLITVDLSFISLRLVLPALKAFAGARILALVKPQFEAKRHEVGRGGVIESAELQRAILERVKAFARDLGYTLRGEFPSPLPGQKGNQEYFLLLD